MEFKNQQKLAGHIMRLLKVSYIDFPIGRANNKNFSIRFDDSGDFTMMLDSVPLSTKNILEDENNIELKKMIEKYCFESVIEKGAWTAPVLKVVVDKPISVQKKRGRPKKVIA